MTVFNITSYVSSKFFDESSMTYLYVVLCGDREKIKEYFSLSMDVVKGD
jgi:hypothetical protein